MNPHVLEALYECEAYFDQRADADHNGISFVPNEEMSLLSAVRVAIARIVEDGKQEAANVR